MIPIARPSSAAALLALLLAACSNFPTTSSSTSGAAQGDAAPLPPEEAAKRRAEILAMRDKALADLVAQKPRAKDELQKAAGYAVFDSSQYNVVLLVGAYGRGVLVDNATQTPTFMVATRAGTGPGVGYKSFRQVMIFKNKSVLDQFRTVGADVSASANATAKLGTSGGTSADAATSFNPYVTMYELTDRGVLLQANWGSAAFLPDAQLNKP
jgi:lipid-binding SYLF domain-containing protein